MKKILILFIVSLSLFLGGCDFPTEEPAPIIPPESVSITSVSVEVTATTAVIKTTVTTNKSVTVSFEYGISDYINVVTTIPSPVDGKMSVSAKISNLSPDTKYKYRIKTVGETTKYFSEPDFFFVTSNQLQIGDSYKNGIIISVNPNLIAAPVDLTPVWGAGLNYFAATEAAVKYGEGYRLPDSSEMKLVKNAKELGILTNFVDPNYDPRGLYFSSTELRGSPDWMFIMEMHKPGGIKYILHKSNSASSRAVCSF